MNIRDRSSSQGPAGTRKLSTSKAFPSKYLLREVWDIVHAIDVLIIESGLDIIPAVEKHAELSGVPCGKLNFNQVKHALRKGNETLWQEFADKLFPMYKERVRLEMSKRSSLPYKPWSSLVQSGMLFAIP